MKTTRSFVLLHGLFADGSSWSEVMPRLQTAGLNVTSVQNPLTTLPEAVNAALQVLGRQNGPTILAGHSSSGMIVTEAGVHENVSALVYVAWLRARRIRAKITQPWRSSFPRRPLQPAWYSMAMKVDLARRHWLLPAVAASILGGVVNAWLFLIRRSLRVLGSSEALATSSPCGRWKRSAN